MYAGVGINHSNIILSGMANGPQTTPPLDDNNKPGTPECTSSNVEACFTPIKTSECSVQKILHTQSPKKRFRVGQQCAICMSDICTETVEGVTETKCKHWFHTACLLQAKCRTASNCPLCRQPLTPPLGFEIQKCLSYEVEIDRLITAQGNVAIPNALQIVAAARRGRNAVRLANPGL